jgi:hypothetical protein
MTFLMGKQAGKKTMLLFEKQTQTGKSHTSMSNDSSKLA